MPVRTLTVAAALLAPAWANAASLELDTVAQLRHDYLGQMWQLVRFDEALGPLSVQGYAGLQWLLGYDEGGDTDLYDLNLGGALGPGSWVLGRQQAMAALRSQAFDGGRVSLPLGDHLRMTAWGGLARHQDLDDLRDGAEMARLELGWSGGLLRARAGAQVETGPQTPLVLRQDAEGLLTLGTGPRPARTDVRVVLAEPLGDDTGSATLEWARADLSLRPWSMLETSIHAQHREAADPLSLFGDALLDALAGGAVQQVGVGLRYLGARWSSVSARYALLSYGEALGGSLGHKVDLAWQPGRTDSAWRLSPALASRSGPGGQYHALYTRLTWQVADATELTGRTAAIPFKKAEDPWALALAGGLELQQRFAAWGSLLATVDLASDRQRLLDTRGGAVLHLEWP